ncbi:MAG: hypothetical protein JWQ58_1438 [Reyranella sp.]|nr:hypothetical protein [Reyranella sp.]
MMRAVGRPSKPAPTELFAAQRVGARNLWPGDANGDAEEQEMVIASGDRGAWTKAETLARRIYQLTTVPMRSENHPTWDPTWRKAMEAAFVAIGSGDEEVMDDALVHLEQLARTL